MLYSDCLTAICLKSPDMIGKMQNTGTPLCLKSQSQLSSLKQSEYLFGELMCTMQQIWAQPKSGERGNPQFML